MNIVANKLRNGPLHFLRLSLGRQGYSANSFNHFQILFAIARHWIAVPPTSLKRKCTFGLLCICFLYLSAFAAPNQDKPTRMTDVAQYDKTIRDTRVVLLAISPTHPRILPSTTSTHSSSNEAAPTNIEITFVTEHIGTNSPRNQEVGSVILYLQKTGQKESPLDFNGIGISTGPGIAPPPLPQVQITDKGVCSTTHVVIKDLYYLLRARVNCLIQCGFDGQLKDFRFNDILLP
jgi:hypothetical protein